MSIAIGDQKATIANDIIQLFQKCNEDQRNAISELLSNIYPKKTKYPEENYRETIGKVLKIFKSDYANEDIENKWKVIKVLASTFETKIISLIRISFSRKTNDETPTAIIVTNMIIAASQILSPKKCTSGYVKTRERMNKLLSQMTNQSYEKICADTERDNFMYADEALAYGLIDKVVEKR